MRSKMNRGKRMLMLDGLRKVFPTQPRRREKEPKRVVPVEVQQAKMDAAVLKRSDKTSQRRWNLLWGGYQFASFGNPSGPGRASWKTRMAKAKAREDVRQAKKAERKMLKKRAKVEALLGPYILRTKKRNAVRKAWRKSQRQAEKRAAVRLARKMEAACV